MPTFRQVCCNIPACRNIVGREFCEPSFHRGQRGFRRRRMETREEQIERERRERGIQPF